MNVAAAAVLASGELSGTDQAVVVALYTAVASASVALAVGHRALAGERGAATLERMRGWLAANDATVMAVLFLVFGVKLVGVASKRDSRQRACLLVGSWMAEIARESRQGGST